MNSSDRVVNCQVFTGLRYDVERLHALIKPRLPEGAFRHIMLKPNWVTHPLGSTPVEGLVTHGAVIEAVLKACRQRYPGAERITVGDCPVQSCDWSRLSAQAGVDELRRRWEWASSPRIEFLDLRRERVKVEDGYLVTDPSGGHGDPRGYRIVDLGAESALDEVSTERGCFRVSDYDPGVTASQHRRGVHRYCISASALEADLFINLPKMKTHQKAGITGALKNLVGVNGEKAYLAHHREAGRDGPGDKYPPDVSPWFVLHEQIRRLLQRRSRVAFRVAQAGWRGIKRGAGIRTELRRGERSRPERVFLSPGSWYGNDTIWRMVYDLNRIIRLADREGRMHDRPQRTYFAILDGIVAGEGPGPLRPWPVEAGVLVMGADPFAVDMLESRLMGFDPDRVPQLANRARFGDPEWGTVRAEDLEVEVDGRPLRGITALAPVHRFTPPPGWMGHIEVGTENLTDETDSAADQL